MNQTLRVLVIEDEPISRALLEMMLGNGAGVELVGTAGSVGDAVEAIELTRPDVVFLDVQMLGGTGFDVIEAIGVANMPPVVFVTAYDQYAVEAFDVAAVDYLLKPFDETRLERCLERVRGRVRPDGSAPSSTDVGGVLDELGSQNRRAYCDTLPVDGGTHVKLIPAAEVNWLEAKGKHVLIHARSDTYRMKVGLSAVAARLDPHQFLRVHRSAIVRADRVRQIHRWTRGDYRLVLEDGTKVVTGTTYKKWVEARLLGDPRPPIP
jgi:two-component system, LytTR family, response regulator